MKHILITFTCILLLAGQVSALPIVENEDSEVDSLASENNEKTVEFQFHPSLGLTYSASKFDGYKTTSLQWLGTVSMDFDYVGPKFQLSSSLFMQYGESKVKGEESETLQDAFILSITPSIPIIKAPAIRLFLETTAETQLGKGMIDDQMTGFLDPLFLYQTLFLGQKHYSYQKDDKTSWELTYGLGYAFQQTLNKDFEFDNNLSGNTDFESGFSGIAEFNIDSQLTEKLSLVLNAKAVALSRENFFSDFNSCRRSVLIRSGLYYNRVGLEYNYHLVHDLNLSADNMTDQSIMLTVGF